ncbi:MAG: glycosyltransferase family 39 protein, partial [Chloroflexota bacterium]|nr:glycosyltransferase family 39 protein [Chloroflexota bacterium]
MIKKPPLRWLLILLACALLAHLLLAINLPPVIATLVVLLLTGWLPGILLVEVLVGQSEAPPTAEEYVLYALGTGYAIIVLVMLGLSYWPGPIAAWQTYLAFDLTLVLLALWVWVQARHSSHSITHHALITNHWSLVTSLALLLLVGGFLRFANLGYAEFHGDEARAVLRAAGVIQGYDDVLFLHKKGPAEVLLPAVVFSLVGRLDEASARLPFAVANLAVLLAVFALGRRMLGTLAGWAAAFLLAFDGYLIAFAHFVQYQSLVLLTSALVVLIVYRLVRWPKALANYGVLAAILWVTGLWGHYDAAAVAAPVLFLVGVLCWHERLRWRPLVRAAWPALGVGSLL